MIFMKRTFINLQRVFLSLYVLCLINFFVFTHLAPQAHAQQGEYENLKADAEKLYAEASYGLAHELYVRADAMDLPPEESRWVDFRVADTLWRSQAGTRTADSTKYDQARNQLEALIRDIQRIEDRDLVWVEVQESLGDFWWTRPEVRNWGQAWFHYQQALDWWAGSSDLELARKRYLHLVWTMARPPAIEPYYYYGYYGNIVPLEILENVLKIAQTENDRAHAHYLIAMTIRQQGGDGDLRQRVPEAFEAALQPGKSTDWYDDALYHYAEWLMSYGRVLWLEEGGWRQELDYVKALELLRRLVNEYEKGETRYYDQAQNQIENLLRPVLGISVANIFLPDSEIQVYLNWRNVRRVDFTLYRVDLTQHLDFSGEAVDSGNWINQIRGSRGEKVKSWSKETGDRGDYKPGQELVRFEEKLPVGAYVLEAKGEGLSVRDLILVTDVSLVVKTSGKQVLVYFCEALNGSPIPEAPVKLWERSYDGQRWIWRENTQKTNQDGISVFDLTDTSNHVELFVSAAAGDRQAFSVGDGYKPARQEELWRIYAFTDRPAYRPEEEVHWKLIARKYDGSVYTTPSGQTLEFEITDPQGSKVQEGKLRLNIFGSAWDSLELHGSLPLGEYQIAFWDEGHQNSLGGATLFRLEEYRLPEFKVSIQTPEEEGRKKAFRLGEKVEVTIQADYYFGGPVTQATVEVLVYQNPFYPWWQPPRDFPWFYEDLFPQHPYYGGGQGPIIRRETLQTDETGKATLTFETPRNARQDFEYRIEARVTDASRREIVGRDTVRVTRQRYYIYPRAEHTIYRPQDKVQVAVKALDANNQPVQVEGTIKVTREYWEEIWLDPNGREVKGEELRTLREKSVRFPPRPPDLEGTPWRLKFRGYQHEEILSQTVQTDVNGEAKLTFTPEREGYYRVTWYSEDKGGASSLPDRPIRAETTVWVATSTTVDLGYRQGGIEIIVDKDTFRVGQKAPVMLVVPTNDRYVLFSVEGEDLYSFQLVHLTGTVKLIEVPIEEKHVPNIFLSAAMVSDHQLFRDTEPVVVPPVQHFLNVEVQPDREQYQPQEEGTLTITTRDQEGHPVAAEVALALVDESVYYIQQDYAGDPRPFYYGTKRSQLIQTQSTFQQRSYVKWVEGPEAQLIEERARDEEAKEEAVRSDEAFRGKDREMRRSLEKVVEADALAGARPELVAPERLAKSEIALAPQAAPPAPSAAPIQEPTVQVRTDFRATVLWQPEVITDPKGQAVVKVKYPDSLTGWKATARVATEGNQFGIATASTRTRQPLIVRLQAPRFFVVGDKVTISAVIHNNTPEAMTVTPVLEAEGVVVQKENPPIPPTIEAHSEARVDWVVSVQQPGQAKLKVTARGDQYADAMEKSYQVYEHGIEKFISKSGKVRGDDLTVKLDIPKERKPESTTLVVQVTPSLAGALLDALPYLIDYPYGCTEQTLSRFLPAVIVAKTLQDLGLQPEAVMGKVFGGIVPGSVEKIRLEGKQNPPFDFAQGRHKLDEVVQQGLNRLYDFQHADGGWGWWKEGDSDPFMTAYVVWGLTLAQEAGITVRAGVLDRGASYLDKELVEAETHYDQQAWLLHALSAYHVLSKRRGVGKFQEKAFENLWTNRDRLNAYTRALLALSAHGFGYPDRAKILVQNLENGVKQDTTPDISIIQQGAQARRELVESQSHAGVLGTAHWGEDGLYWRWSEGGVEATAFALRALLAIDPVNKLIEPVTNWLIKNRRGAQWSNTRDTAITILALTDYLRQTRELEADLEYELLVNGQSLVTQKLTAEEVLQAPSQFLIDSRYIQNGSNEIRMVRKGGQGPIYFAAQAQFFSLEEPIPAAGQEIFVHRQYYRLIGRPTLLKGYVYEKLPLQDGETVLSGERVETVLTIEAKNNYEYLVFEDLKPAGLEAVQIRSGEPLYARELKSGVAQRKFKDSPECKVLSAECFYSGLRTQDSAYTGRTRWVYQELRDRKVVLFIDKLPEGFWEIRYDLRAEVPGQFHALPLLGYAMYVPEIRANGAEARITVIE